MLVDIIPNNAINPPDVREELSALRVAEQATRSIIKKARMRLALARDEWQRDHRFSNDDIDTEIEQKLLPVELMSAAMKDVMRYGEMIQRQRL